MMSITKYTIRKPNSRGGFEKYYELFDQTRQFIIRLDDDNEIMKIFPVNKNYFDNFTSYETNKMTIKDTLLEKAYKYMSIYINHDKDFRIIQDFTKDEMFQSMKHFTSQGIKQYEQNKLHDAINTFKYALEYKINFSLFLWISKCYIKMNFFDNAIEYINMAYRNEFYNYDEIIEDNLFEPIFNEPKFIESIRKMFNKRPGKTMSIRTIKYLHKHGIVSLDDEEPSGKRQKVDEVESARQKVLENKQNIQSNVSAPQAEIQQTINHLPQTINHLTQTKEVSSLVVTKKPMMDSNLDKIPVPKEQLYYMDYTSYGTPFNNPYGYPYGYPVGNQYGFTSQRYFDDKQRPEVVELIKSAVDSTYPKNITL